MTVFTIGKLTLASRTQAQKHWMEREQGVLVYQAKPADLRIEHGGRPCLMATALAQALSLMISPHGADFSPPSRDELVGGWQGIFSAQGDPHRVARMTTAILDGSEFRTSLAVLLGRQVTTISAEIPYHWRLHLLWDPPLRLAPGLEWVFDFKPSYEAKLVQEPQFA